MLVIGRLWLVVMPRQMESFSPSQGLFGSQNLLSQRLHTAVQYTHEPQMGYHIISLTSMHLRQSSKELFCLGPAMHAHMNFGSRYLHTHTHT